jgi:hypothetical protein
MDYEQELGRIAQQYQDEGYVVVTHPDKDHLPDFAAESGADLLATRGTEKVLVLVKRTRADLESDPAVAHRAAITNGQPGWRYDLVVLEPDSPLGRAGRLVGEPTLDQIEQIFAEAERVLPVSPRGAFVLAWSGLEAAMRRYSQHLGVNGHVGIQPLTMVRELYSKGYISRDDFAQMEEARRLRAVVVHGLAPLAIDGGMVQSVVDMARRLLADSEKPQAVAG